MNQAGSRFCFVIFTSVSYIPYQQRRQSGGALSDSRISGKDSDDRTSRELEEGVGIIQVEWKYTPCRAGVSPREAWQGYAEPSENRGQRYVV